MSIESDICIEHTWFNRRYRENMAEGAVLVAGWAVQWKAFQPAGGQDWEVEFEGGQEGGALAVDMALDYLGDVRRALVDFFTPQGMAGVHP